MFATFTTATVFAIATTENLITDLEQQLQAARQELAQLQQQQQAEQTAKSAAETALEMVRKARKLVQVAYGDAAVEEFNRVLVEDEPVGELAPSAIADRTDEVEVEPSPEASPNAPSDDPATVTVEATVIEVNDSKAQEVGESQVEPDSQQIPSLPFPSAIASMKKPDLIKHLEAHGLPTDGLTKDLKSRLTAYVLNQPTITKAA